MIEPRPRLRTVLLAIGLGLAFTGVIVAQAAGHKLSGGSFVEEESVRFSEDGNWVVYIEYDSPGGTLYSTSIDGGVTHRLADSPIPNGGIFIQPTVSPDSHQVVFVADHDADEVWELYSVPIDGSAAPTKLNATLPSGGDVIVDVYVTADSSSVVYTADQVTDDVFELYSVPIDGSAGPTKLSGTLTSGGDVSLGRPSPDGQTVIYRADQNTDELWELLAVPVDASSAAVKISGTPAGGGDVFGTWLVSPDGTRVVYLGDQDTVGVLEIYSTPIDGSSAPVKLNGTMTTGGDAFAGFEITADSARVVYQADQDTDTVFELYSAPIDGSSSATKLNDTLVAGGNVDWTFRITDDSTRVVYLADQQTDEVFELYSVPIGGGTAVRLHDPLTATEDVRAATFRVVGNRVVFVSDQESDDVFELYSAAITGGSSVKISGTMPATGDITWISDVGSDSNRVLYKADQEADEVFELFAVPAGGGPVVKATEPVIPPGGDVNFGFFVPGNDAVVVTHADTETDGVYELFASRDVGFEFLVDDSGDAGDLDPNDGLCKTGTGVCTLRAALDQANATEGLNRITFAIPGAGPHTISPTFALPTSTDFVEIDATTQPSYAGTPLVAIDGIDAGPSSDGLTVTGHSTIRGLAVTGFTGDGIVLSGGGNKVESCYVGIDPDGTVNANTGIGVNLFNPAGDKVGGVSAAGNVISGNGSHGVLVAGSGLGWVSGNLIGTDVAGTAPVPNGGHGVAVNAAGALEVHIGHAVPSFTDGNVLAFNTLDGVSVSGATPNVWFWNNSVHDNGGLGIDYVPPDGVGGGTYAAPTITGVTVAGGSTEISGTMPSAWATFAIGAYSSGECDASGSGEGEVFLGIQGFDAAPTDTFTITLPRAVAPRDVVTVTFIAEDSSTSEFSECFVVNEPPVAADATWSVPEDSTLGTAVGTVSATDADGDTLSYAITAGNSAGAFAINNSGEITVAAPLDFETTTTYELTVEVSDGLQSATATATINITNVNEAPTVADATWSVAEDAVPGTVVGTVSGSDVDGDTLSYAITAGNSAGAFAIDNATGEITVAAPLDFETTTTYELTVEVSDGLLTATATATINITDVGEFVAPDEATFTDIPTSHLFFAEVEWLAWSGITAGCNPPLNTQFCPDNFVTRGQMAAFLHRALGDVLTPGTPMTFTDDDGSIFEDDIEWLAATGVTRGCNPPDNTNFCPTRLVTRGQMAAFLERALG